MTVVTVLTVVTKIVAVVAIVAVVTKIVTKNKHPSWAKTQNKQIEKT